MRNLKLIFDPEEKMYNYANKRASDLEENNKVTLPKSGDAKQEAELEMIRNIIIEEFLIYKKKIEKEEEERDRNT